MVAFMTFAEKLRKLAGSENKTELAEKLGVGISTLGQWMAGTSLPRADRAFALAGELGVDIRWLLDDSDESLDPPPAVTLANVPDQDLLEEMARRYRLLAVSLYQAMDEARKGPWEHAAIWLHMNPIDVALPEAMKDQLAGATLLNSLMFRVMTHVNVSRFAEKNHHRLPGSDLPKESLTPEGLRKRFDELDELHPGIEAVMRYGIARRSWGKGPDVSAAWGQQQMDVLAHLVTHASTAGNPKYDALRDSLRKSGHIDSRGRPAFETRSQKPKAPPRHRGTKKQRKRKSR